MIAGVDDFNFLAKFACLFVDKHFCSRNHDTMPLLSFHLARKCRQQRSLQDTGMLHKLPFRRLKGLGTRNSRILEHGLAPNLVASALHLSRSFFKFLKFLL